MNTTTVTTASGQLLGRVDEGVHTFLGVPYRRPAVRPQQAAAAAAGRAVERRPRRALVRGGATAAQAPGRPPGRRDGLGPGRAR